jgi:hypothetical protein
VEVLHLGIFPQVSLAVCCFACSDDAGSLLTPDEQG